MTPLAHKTDILYHTGQRTLKMTGDASTVDVNAWEQHTYGCLDHVTLYPSPYMVLTEQGYTKHYYAGTERVAARIGSGGLSYDATCVTGNGEVAKRSDELFWKGVKLLNERGNKPEDFKEMSLVDAKGNEVDWHKKIDLDKLAMSWQLEAKIDPWKIHSVIDDNSYPATPGNTRYENEPDVYFYHSDHLGGASWITDVNGKPVQHLQYLPFGEPYVNQHSAGYQERFTFTGKERDEETGYGYFGARYMDYSMMTMWLSVDPMADKYPSISPYAYCIWNPVKLVDPDGFSSDDPPLRKYGKEIVKIGIKLLNHGYKKTHPKILSDNIEATAHYYLGKGKPIGLTTELGDKLVQTKDFQKRHRRIVQGKTTSLSGNFAVDMTLVDPTKTFFIGDTRVDYIITVSDDKKTCTVTYTLFSHDGFYDPNFVAEECGNAARACSFGLIDFLKADGEGNNLELGGIPYNFIPQKRMFKFKNPGYVENQ